MTQRRQKINELCDKVDSGIATEQERRKFDMELEKIKPTYEDLRRVRYMGVDENK